MFFSKNIVPGKFPALQQKPTHPEYCSIMYMGGPKRKKVGSGVINLGVIVRKG